MPDVPFSNIFNGVRRSFSDLKTPSEIFTNYFKIAKLVMPSSVKEILSAPANKAVPFLDYFTTYAKQHFDSFPPLVLAYCELSSLVGYPLPKFRKNEDDPVLWLTRDVNDQHSSSWYSGRMLQILTSNNPKPSLDYDSFVLSRWLWISDGATSNSHLSLNGEIIKTKFGAAVSLSDAELLKLAYAPAADDLSIFVKGDERGVKKRLIASVNMSGYLKAAYVRYLLQNLGSVSSFMKDSLSLEDDLMVMDLLRRGNTAVPIDESKFDYHVSRAALLGFTDAISQLFPENSGVKVFCDWFLNMPRWRYEQERGFWLKGQPSGLALTSLLNSLINYCKQLDIESPVHWALGDDVLVFNSDLTLEEIANHYATFGSVVNPKKNFKSDNYAEYLHFVYTKYGKTGYPARVYSSLIWSLEKTPVDPATRLFELTNLFKEFYDRAFLYMDEKLVSADLSRSVSRKLLGFNSRIASLWIHIPRCLGGFGLVPIIDHQFVLKHSETTRSYYCDSILRLPPVVKHAKFSFRIVPFKTATNVRITSGPCANLPTITDLTRWEQRLNLDEPDVSRLQYQYGTATIPLPSIPFVSDTRMSVLARHYGCNAWPLVTGKAHSRLSRFLLMSQWLVVLATDLLLQNKVSFYL